MLQLKKTAPRACWLVGHRGAAGHAPENTMASFRAGREMGADLVECDVHLSRDEQVIVIHDETLDRTTRGKGAIREHAASFIRKQDAGSRFSKKFQGEPVPDLDQLLAWAAGEMTLAGQPLKVVIEIKNEKVHYHEIELRVLDCVRKHAMEDRVILISFDHEVIRRAKKAAQRIAAGILYGERLEDPVARAEEVGADALFPRRNLVAPKLVEKAHRRNLAVATWTVNAPREMKKLISSGTDAIATNFPDKLNRILQGS